MASSSRKRVLFLAAGGFAAAATAVVMLERRRLRNIADGKEELVSFFFGEDKAELLRGVDAALDALKLTMNGSKATEHFSDSPHYPLLANLTLVALAEEIAEDDPRPSSEPLDVPLKYMQLASAAYGAVMLASLGMVSGTQAMAARSVVNSTKCVEEWDMSTGVSCHVPSASLSLVSAKKVGIPAHFVAKLDSETILCIRGTRSVDDAIVDVVASSVNAPELGGPECYAHEGIRAAARRIIAGPAGEILKDEERIVVVGHSLGAGCATLVALELARRQPSKQITCYAFSPPPVATCSATIPENCRIVIVVNGADVVPSLSLSSVARVLAAAARVDALSLSILDRIKLLASSRDHVGELVRKIRETNVHEPSEDDDKDHPAPLRLIGNVLYHFHNQGTSYSVTHNPEDVFRTVKIHPRMVFDHFPHTYENAIANALASVAARESSSANTTSQDKDV